MRSIDRNSMKKCKFSEEGSIFGRIRLEFKPQSHVKFFEILLIPAGVADNPRPVSESHPGPGSQLKQGFPNIPNIL